MQRLVKYICSVLLGILVITMANNQENTTWQDAMPQGYASHSFNEGRPAAERTIAHLFDERIAMPIHVAGETPGYHPHHSKPKCLHTADKLNRYSSCMLLNKGSSHSHARIYHHVIDYYIYTLEHILI